ncbi:MAG: hypothetical protein GWP19_06650 [Planctomycetia bacterium]|nr:hypothetical protein [Planctomycetia bacterium]
MVTNRINRTRVRKKTENEGKWQYVKCGSKEKLEYDHIIPHNKGGSDTVRSIQLLCESCNRKKSDKIM